MIRSERFEVDGPPNVFVRLPAGDARVVAGAADIVEIHLDGQESALERFTIARRGEQIVIEPEGSRFGRWAGVDVEVCVGPGALVHARLASGDLEVATAIAALTVEVGSGDVRAGSVDGDVKVKTASGDVHIDRIGGRLDVASASGELRVGSVVGSAGVKTASGDITVGSAQDVSAHSASGDITVERFEGDDFTAKTLSGDVRIAVTGGRRFSVDFATLSGEVRTDFPVDDTRSSGGAARLSVKTMSGDIVVRGAAQG